MSEARVNVAWLTIYIKELTMKHDLSVKSFQFIQFDYIIE